MNNYEYMADLLETEKPSSIYIGFFETENYPPYLFEDTDITYKEKIMYCVNNDKRWEDLTEEEMKQFYPKHDDSESVVLY